MNAKHLHQERTIPINSYYDPHLRVATVKIMPGELCVVTDETLIVTVLGSTVTTCIRDRIRGIGGMNHFLVANINESREENNYVVDYGTFVMDRLLQQLEQRGAQRKDLEAKVFGGGSILNQLNRSNAGSRSARFARDYLAAERIPIVAEDTLDIYPRKVYFYPNTGIVMVKKLKTLNNGTIIRREKEYTSRLFAGKLC